MSNESKDRAVDWFVRLRAPDTTAQERDAHGEWLAEDPAHRAVHGRIDDLWRSMSGLGDWAETELRHLESTQDVRKRQRLGYWLLGFATAAIGMLAVLFVFYSPLPDSTSEHIATTKGEQRRVMLEDGSRVHLNSASAVDVVFSQEERGVRLLAGEGLFDVGHDPERPFVVHVPGSKVVAVGTRFNVHIEGGNLSVTVLEGKVIVVPGDTRPRVPLIRTPEPRVLLEPNQQARLDVSGAIEAIKTVDATRLTAWDNGLLVFDNTPLREVAAEISRYIGGEIQVASDVPDYPVTGTIKIRDKETMLRVLAEVAPITPVRASAAVTTLMYSPGPRPGEGHQ